MKLRRVNEDEAEEVIEEIGKRENKGIKGYVDEVTCSVLELFVRLQRIEERLEKLEKIEEE